MTLNKHITVQRYGKPDAVLQKDGSTYRNAEGHPRCRLNSYSSAALHWLLLFKLSWVNAHLSLNRTASGQYVHHAVLQMEDGSVYLIPAGSTHPIAQTGKTYEDIIASLRGTQL